MDIDRELRRIAGAAQGAYMTTAGVPPDAFRPRAARSPTGCAQRRARTASPRTRFTAAQAAEVLLDAIARSDGTRPSVAAALRRIHTHDGLLGDVRFDARGNLVERPFTVFRF